MIMEANYVRKVHNMLRAYNAQQQIFLTFDVRLLVCAVHEPNHWPPLSKSTLLPL